MNCSPMGGLIYYSVRPLGFLYAECLACRATFAVQSVGHGTDKIIEKYLSENSCCSSLNTLVAYGLTYGLFDPEI
jgi:hypothetical protein